MKKFTTIKVGYGCSGEYFTTIIIDGENTNSISHYGLYGSEDRVGRVLKDAGFTEFYTPSDFGKMAKKTIWKGFISEYEAVEQLKETYHQ